MRIRRATKKDAETVSNLNRVVQQIHADAHPETPHGYYQRHIHIHHLSVNPGYRCKGFGAQLIEKAEEVARELAIDKVTLSVWHFNESARRFFSSQGFLAYNIRMWKEIT